MEISESVQHLKSSFSNIKDWDKSTFSYEKAFVCSVMSNLAYCHLTDFELENTEHVNLIPSDAFGTAYSEKRTSMFKLLLSELGTENPIIIERAGSVTVAFQYHDVVFISMRGTESFKDWRKNLKFRKITPSRYVRDESKVKLHKGFYFEVDSFMDTLVAEIRERGWQDKKIYITGHSLGGALAALTYALRIDGFHYFYDDYLYHRKGLLNIVSCYTFGMPRWGNEAAIEHFPSPYHVFVSNDIVPSLPPKRFGFDDCKINFNLDAQAFKYVDFSDGSFKSYIKNFKLFITKGKLEDHRIENYVERIYHKK